MSARPSATDLAELDMRGRTKRHFPPGRDWHAKLDYIVVRVPTDEERGRARALLLRRGHDDVAMMLGLTPSPPGPALPLRVARQTNAQRRAAA